MTALSRIADRTTCSPVPGSCAGPGGLDGCGAGSTTVVRALTVAGGPTASPAAAAEAVAVSTPALVRSTAVATISDTFCPTARLPTAQETVDGSSPPQDGELPVARKLSPGGNTSVNVT